MKRLRWGVLSTAEIALDKVIPAMQKSPDVDVAAIASRDGARAAAAAERLRIPCAYGSYEELLADPDVDVVYNPLPNHLHVPWSIRALEAGKHVLVEKPIGLTSDEGRLLVEAANAHPDLKVMEAVMYRHHPQWKRAKSIVDEGGIGDLRTVHSFFSYANLDPNDIRNHADLGGGGLMDIGCYNVSLSRFLFDDEPSRLVGAVEYDPTFETDRLASAIMEFGRGTATFTCSTQVSPHQRVQVFGTEGRVEIEIPFNTPQDGPARLWHERGDRTTELVFDRTDQYTLQAEELTRVIMEDAPVPYPISDAVANMVVLEAIVESARRSAWVTLDR